MSNETAAGDDVLLRRRLLAELLVDTVLDRGPDAGSDRGCNGTEKLTASVTDSVCAYLGHPRRCPHGTRIPTGACCRSSNRTVRPLVQPLNQLDTGEQARVVYLVPTHPDQLLRLSNLGVVPGATIRLQQKRPAAVIAVGETHLALDTEITEAIYVKKVE